MTTQVSEILRHNGESLRMCAVPLSFLLKQQSVPWSFKATNITSLHRRYVGTWQIEEDRLYLKHIEEVGDAFGQWNPVPLESVFPGFRDGIFAHWFTGDLRCTRGAFLKRVLGAFRDVYEEDVFLRFQRGVLEKEWVVRNGTSSGQADAGYQAEAAT